MKAVKVNKIKVEIPPMAALSIVAERCPPEEGGFDLTTTLKCYDAKGEEIEMEKVEKYILSNFLALATAEATRESYEEALGYSESDGVIKGCDDYEIL